MQVVRLQAMAADLGRTLTTADVARAVISHGMVGSGALTGAMALVRAGSGAIELLGAEGIKACAPSARKLLRLGPGAPLSVAIRAGEPLWLAEADKRVAIACIPLKRSGLIWGALAFVFERPHTFAAVERAFFTSLSHHCINALERSQIHEAERRGRQVAESAAARLARLQRVTAALNCALDIAEVAAVVAREGLGCARAQACVVAAWEDGASRILAQVGADDAAWQGRSEFWEQQMSAVVQSGEPLWPEPRGQSERFACVPVMVGGRVLGALGLQIGERSRLPSAARGFLNTLADLAGQAMERARLYEGEREARARAEQANRMKDEFLGLVSHELRTPLTAIAGWVTLLRRRPADPESLARTLEKIDRNTTLQSRLVEDLIDASRIVLDKFPLEFEPVDLQSVLENARDALINAAQAKELSMRLHLPKKPIPFLRGDGARLEQVFRNLLSNAIKFTPKGGWVDVRCRLLPGVVRIDVIDTGEGIEPEMLPHIFERFWQGDGSISRRHSGLGLGLSIVRYLVEAHGGKVWAESGGKGKGTTMAVELPLGQPLAEVNGILKHE